MQVKDVIRVRVTQEDIDKGTAGSCSGCPIALAIHRVMPGNRLPEETVDVKAECVFVGDDSSGRSTLYAIPMKAHNFILHFDAGRRNNFVRPMSFCIVRLRYYQGIQNPMAPHGKIPLHDTNTRLGINRFNR